MTREMLPVAHCRITRPRAACEDLCKDRRVDVAVTAFYDGAFARTTLALADEAGQRCRARAFRDVVRVGVVEAHCIGDLGIR